MSFWKDIKWERLEPSNPGVILFRISGSMNGGEDSYALLADVRKDVQAGVKHMVLNLEGVDRIDSTGVGILCACYTSINNAGGKMYLVGVNERNQALMKVVGLWDQLLHFPTEQDVVFED